MKITYLTPCEYLSRKHERPLPENIDDELARYALYFPDTMDLYEAYIKQPSTLNGLIYQEQMLDILRQVFHVGCIKADQIRLAIQRGEAEQVEAYRQKLFSDLKDITPDEAERAWQRLTSNPRAFLKAHAISQVLAKYKFEMK
jgi:DNA polymerase III alpha subunit